MKTIIRILNQYSNMNLSANSLFHITPKLEFLINILEKGFHPKYCIEEIGFFTIFNKYNLMLGQPMTCFCDIPLGSIGEHVNKYGFYGLGMNKKWGKAKSISPVTYVYPQSATADLIKIISYYSLRLLIEDKHDKFIGLTQILKNYFKSISGHIYKNGKFSEVEYNFYNEREWRYVPFQEIENLSKKIEGIQTFLEKSDFDQIDIREKHNAYLSENCSLQFTLLDINYLFVKDEKDFEVLVDFIETYYLKDYTAREISRLISKIQILDNLMSDL